MRSGTAGLITREDVLAELNEIVEPPADLGPWIGRINGWKRSDPLDYDPHSPHILPQHAIRELWRLTQDRPTIIATGVGQHQMWAAQFYKFRRPRRWLSSAGLGTMGFGLPAAIGAQFANPGKTVIDIDGDASVRMNIGELETITNYGLPIKVVVLNNQGDGMVRQWQKLFFKGRFSASDKSLHKKDFVKAAEADGFPWARRIDKPEEVAAVVAEFVAFNGPALLEVVIDPDAGVYPMVGPGMSYAQMITGDFIASRAQVEARREVDKSEMF